MFSSGFSLMKSTALGCFEGDWGLRVGDSLGTGKGGFCVLAIAPFNCGSVFDSGRTGEGCVGRVAAMCSSGLTTWVGEFSGVGEGAFTVLPGAVFG